MCVVSSRWQNVLLEFSTADSSRAILLHCRRVIARAVRVWWEREGRVGVKEEEKQGSGWWSSSSRCAAVTLRSQSRLLKAEERDFDFWSCCYCTRDCDTLDDVDDWHEAMTRGERRREDMNDAVLH